MARCGPGTSPAGRSAGFETATGLKLAWEGTLKEDLPPMPKFLNRLLALPIDEQNDALFAELEAADRREHRAGDGGRHLRAGRGEHPRRYPAGRHPGRCCRRMREAGAATELVEIVRRDRLQPLTAEAALQLRDRLPAAGLPAAGLPAAGALTG